MNNLEILNGLLTAIQQQQFRMPQQQQQQQQPSPQQMALNQVFMNQMLQNLRFPFPLPMPVSPMPSMNSGIKMSPKVNKETAAPLQKWFDSNIQNPYPTEEDMKMFKNLTGFTDTQLGDWFRNKRRNYKKNHNGDVPWQTPTTTIRKRRASSISTHQNDSNSSLDSVSTAHSSPIPPITPVSTQEPSDTSPPEKRAKSFSVNDFIQ
uniref:Homeobox domain-containing protein n=1 Tax=Panagrolaimus sp. PS1159 TaxID=55785 RepID=A0AC35GZ32_9BILA